MIDKLRKLVREIHRRSVWQVLGVYLAAALAAFELSGSLTDAAGLPEWFPTFALALLILGLPMVIATAYVQDTDGGDHGPSTEMGGAEEHVARGGPGPEGARPDADVDAGPGWLTWKHVFLGGVAALALWGGVATVLWLTGGPPTTSPQPRIAVLPIDNLTGTPDNQWIADGLHDEVITRLQQAGGLRVISRTSTLRYRGTDLSILEIARELDAEVILEATLQASGGIIRLNAQLVDGESDEHIWAETFDREIAPDALLTAQTDLAVEVATILAGQLTSAERDRVTAVGTDDAEAQRQYLLGISYRNSGRPEDLRASIDAYERALELDPDFALAHSAMAESYMIIAHGAVPPWEAFPPGEAAAREALALEPDLAEALTTLADVAYHYRWSWPEAESRFRRALELNPSHATAHWWLAGLLSTLRRHEEAVEHARQALPLDPRNVVARGFVARVLFWAGRHQEAVDVLDEGLLDDPNHPTLLEMKGTVLLRAGRSEAERQAGLELLRRAADMGAGPARFSYAAGLAALGRTGDAREILETALSRAGDGSYVPRYYLAGVAAEIGDGALALELLGEAAEVREAPAIWLNIDPVFRSLHGDPEFRRLLDEMGLSAGAFDGRGAPGSPG